MTRFGRQPVAGAQQGYPHRPTRTGEPPGDDEAVTAVVAGTAEDDDRPRGPALLDRVGDSGACVIHQLDARGARGNSQTVGLANAVKVERPPSEGSLGIHQTCSKSRTTRDATSPRWSLSKIWLMADRGCRSMSALTLPSAAKASDSAIS